MFIVLPLYWLHINKLSGSKKELRNVVKGLINKVRRLKSGQNER